MSRDLKFMVEELVSRLKGKGSVLVAFSGGVDSSLVAYLAHLALGNEALAVTIKSPLSPFGELEEAIEIAKLIGIRHEIVELNELEIPGFSSNPRDRCYLCKKFRFKKLKELASQRGIRVIVDGTSKSDALEHRPGIRALIEEGVYSPLLEAGFTKDQVREIVKLLNLPFHDKPPNSCLMTRIPYGSEVTLERLARIGLAEKIVKERLKLRMIRVRDHGDLARIEVSRDERRLFFDETVLDFVANELKRLGFKFVTLDVEGYRTGSFDL
ncbi:MAG: ATP-dependent sacrificial sulfur transferase LarE [Candidatus Nezhaarchaeota archaeon]|nr:ATP-dependent sacrificial sulfur transferase LarE [Candidatus Nezhaarchaeota archaeon]